MEIVIVVFLCAWVTACGLLAWGKVRRDLRGSEREERKK